MRKQELFTMFAAAILAATMLAFAPTASGQRPPPVVSVNPKAIEQKSETVSQASIVKRLDALEAENKELKSQLFTMKFLLTGLDKGIGEMNKTFAAHTHRIRATATALTLKCDIPVGQCKVLPSIDGALLYVNKSEQMLTTPPQNQ